MGEGVEHNQWGHAQHNQAQRTSFACESIAKWMHSGNELLGQKSAYVHVTVPAVMKLPRSRERRRIQIVFIKYRCMFIHFKTHRQISNNNSRLIVFQIKQETRPVPWNGLFWLTP